MAGHKTSLNKFKKIETISSTFLDYNGLKLETNLKEKKPKHSKSWILSSMLLNSEWVKNEIKEQIKNVRLNYRMFKNKCCLCSQHRSTQIHKENLGGLQERY